MPGPFEAAGTTKDPTKYGALGQGGRELTGLYTQRSPYRDAAVPYLVAKFYGGSRFDSQLDGLNREIGARLTDVRRPGNPAFGSSWTFGPVDNFYSFKSIGELTETEVVQLMADTTSYVYDITNGLNWPFLNKTLGAGKTRFIGVRTTLFMSDGPDQKKLISPGGWVASKAVDPGTIINDVGYDETTQTVQMALGGISMNIVGIIGNTTYVTVYVDPVNVPLNFANLLGVTVAFSGLSTATYLNGNSYAVASIISSTLGIFTIALAGHTAVFAADTGTASTGDGTTGSSSPTFSSTQFDVVADAGQQWKCYGPSLENWGLAVPKAAATITPGTGRFWQPSTALSLGFAILDSNGNVEVVATAGTTGISYPKWTTQATGTSYAVVSATQNANLASLRPFYQTPDPDTTPPISPYIYRNTSGVALLVQVSADAGGGGFHGTVYADGNASPTTAIAQFCRVNAGSSTPNIYPGSVTFLVPPGGYYGISVTSGGASPSEGITWTEWELNGASSAGSGISSGATGSPVNTPDGSVVWANYGPPGSWQVATAFDGPWDPIAPVGAILDSNGNWQYVTAGGGGVSGATEPAWGTNIGDTVTDGALTWTCLGPGIVLTFKTVQWSFSTHAIDGSVSTAAPLTAVQGPIVGPAIDSFYDAAVLTLAGAFEQDEQTDQIWIWRTAQGEATPILEDQIPIDPFYAGAAFTYDELGINDSSISGSASLNALIAAPISSANNPPISGQTGPVQHLQRLWMFRANVLSYSGGPDTIVGNGFTAWPPINQFIFPGEIIKLRAITVQNGGLLVYTTAGIQIVLGTGTFSNPFYATVYTPTVILGNYDAEDILGTVLYLMESNGVVSSLTVEYPFNPQSGYAEVGFPIGDQFIFTSTGGVNAAIFDPKTTYLSWNRNRSADTAMYVADGLYGWFRLSMANAPESGLIWSPFAQIQGGTSAVQNVETSPGVFNLLLGSSGSGYISVRDTTGTTWQDLGGPYESWDAKGVTQLCSTGEIAEVAWVATKSAATGKRPTISVLMNEVKTTTGTPWIPLQPTSQDPGSVPPSASVYSDRYETEQNGVPMRGDTALIRFDYGMQDAGDELLEFQIYGSKQEERHQ